MRTRLPLAAALVLLACCGCGGERITPRKQPSLVATTLVRSSGRSSEQALLHRGVRRFRKSGPPGGSSSSSSAASDKRWRTGRIALNLVLWWSLNVFFNLLNKACLNAWPHPWALATSHLAVGSACMLPLWVPLPRRDPAGGVRWAPLRAAPRLGWAEVKLLLPVRPTPPAPRARSPGKLQSLAVASLPPTRASRVGRSSASSRPAT